MADKRKATSMSELLLQQIARKLGGTETLGRDVKSDGDLVRCVRIGLQTKSISFLINAGFTRKEIFAYVIPEKTLQNRRRMHQTLTVDESDKVVRLARVQALAEETFEDSEKANAWLRHPLKSLNGEAPLAIARSETGARLIENMLAKIAWGAAA